ncbi:MAG TPA: alpha/beta fold hydrolase [Fervidobacterium sp.]|nr:alpha/beta fold hydrolase [Fervidobacterium sp.]HUM43838.1 alpha/beta fold hydrolase [Fervidobacterium sp.]
MSDMTLLKEFLSLKYLGKWDWSPSGRYIAFIWNDGGAKNLWIVQPEVSAAKKTLPTKDQVSDFSWLPESETLFYADGNGIYRLSASSQEGPQLVYGGGEAILGVSCSPDGSEVAFSQGGRLYKIDTTTHAIEEIDLPGSLSLAGGLGTTGWSPSGNKIAFSFQDVETYHQIGVVEKDGTLIWKSHYKADCSDFCWLDEENLYFAIHRDFGASTDLMVVSFSSGKPCVNRFMVIEGSGKGPVLSTRMQLSPDRTKGLLLLEDTGFAHYHLVDWEKRTLRQVTFGNCEDFGHAGDFAAWYPDSSAFLYSSNKNEKGQRQLFRCTLDNSLAQEVISLPGTNSMPKFSSDGRIAFVHCDSYRNMDLWVCDGEGRNLQQITFSMPDSLTEEKQFVPEEVSFKSAGDITIYGYLMKPKHIAPGEKIPGLVWVHGGPVRQMRPGWHPLASYALFHSLNQYLVHRGYAVLSVNFRGGIGYGRDFRDALYHKMGIDDVADVVNAGRFLKSLPYIDSERVGVWGLSYGGYMTLHSLTQYPKEFKAGVNIAGIWDFSQYTRWAEKRYGKGAGLFKIYLGGDPEDAEDLYAQASPATFAEKMSDPLMSLHGTKDANVDFEQLDHIIKDCVKLRKSHEAIYYPDETHTFTHRHTWLDAIPKIERFFSENL